MIKIYIGDKPIILSSKIEDNLKFEFETVEYNENKEELLNYIESIEKQALNSKGLFIYSTDYEKLKEDFFSFYKLIEAAGAVVINIERDILGIFRNGFWDLPKGKIEKNESLVEAAIREVKEETGIKNLIILEYLKETYHTYFDELRNQRILKKSYWYFMETPDYLLTPQKEEGIEVAKWIDLVDFIDIKPIHNNILDVLKFL
jgi:8-oxo-dGTP pyrophosphatase MutT (NUDIX family)